MNRNVIPAKAGIQKNLNSFLVDDNNCLNLQQGEENIPLNGTFSIAENNKLIYRLNEPQAWRRKYGLGKEIEFEGKWLLNANHDLELRLSRNNGILILNGEIISAEANRIVFQISSYDKNGLNNLRILKLGGAWQADEYNRLSFYVKRAVSPDVLTFTGAWQVNKNQQIEYTCQKTFLKRKEKTVSKIEFNGFWQITSKNRLSYILSAATNSRFDFRAYLGTATIYPNEGAIKYRIGIGVKEVNPKKPKIISLYGDWKIGKDLGLNFEMEYARGRFKSLEFGTEIDFSRDDSITFNLKNSSGGDLGARVVFTHRF